MSTVNTAAPASDPDLGLARFGWFGGLSLVLLVGILGAWACLSLISGAVIASGQTVVHGKPKLVQSLDGGVVAEILVQDGDIVAAGDIMMRLDPTLVEVNLDIAQTQLAAALALQARLLAEQNGLDAPVFEALERRAGQIDTRPHEEGQRQIFVARAALRQGQRAQLAEALLQFDNQGDGLRGQIAALHDQVALLDQDLENMLALTTKGLARQSQMSELQRAKAQLAGQLAALEAELARLANARRDARLSTLQAEHSFMENVVTELREVTARIDELTLQIITHKAQLSRIDIPAPTAGIVHEMQVTTRGGIVPPGGEIASIVPLDDGVDFDLRIDPHSIDQVYPGQQANLMIASLDPQTTPQLKARVTSISPDVIEDKRSGQYFYRVGLTLEPDELARLGTAPLMPGMPVEAYLQTGEHSVLSYLLHPVTSHLRRALRE